MGDDDNKSDNDQMNLKVVGQDGQVIAFKIKRSTPFRKLMAAYCDRTKVVQSTVRFTFDGSRINDTDTPKSMDMEDNDTIEVFTQQTGGSQDHHHHNYQTNTFCESEKSHHFNNVIHFIFTQFHDKSSNKINFIENRRKYSHYDTL